MSVREDTATVQKQLAQVWPLNPVDKLKKKMKGKNLCGKKKNTEELERTK